MQYDYVKMAENADEEFQYRKRYKGACNAASLLLRKWDMDVSIP